MTSVARFRAILLLGLALLVFVGTDRWFSVLEDETSIVTLARRPLLQTVGVFWGGEGQHQHPPLSDILVHAWLPIGGGALWSLRLPSVLFFLTGLFVFALAARKIAGDSAFTTLLCIGVLWPFGFHFGRLIGWYSFCFFLVASVTLAYLRYLEKPGWQRLGVFVVTAVLLVYSNYYGWVVICCLAVDMSIVRRHEQAQSFLLVTFGTLILAYTPIWVIFVNQIVHRTDIVGSALPIFSKILNGIYNFYALFVSESVAPWIWYLSVPASIGIAGVVFLTISLSCGESRRFLVYFGVLFGGMAALGIVNTKRLLFISGWLLLPLATALSSPDNRIARRTLALALACVAMIGWTGVVTRKYYAAPHFIEPWAAIADEAAVSVRDGGIVISNSPSFLFNMNYSLERLGLLPPSVLPGWVEHPKVFTVERWIGSDHPTASSVFLVKGVNKRFMDKMEKAEAWFQSNCVSISSRLLVQDSGYAFKARFFAGSGQQPYRISLQRYDCLRAVK